MGGRNEGSSIRSGKNHWNQNQDLDKDSNSPRGVFFNFLASLT